MKHRHCSKRAEVAPLPCVDCIVVGFVFRAIVGEVEIHRACNIFLNVVAFDYHLEVIAGGKWSAAIGIAIEDDIEGIGCIGHIHTAHLSAGLIIHIADARLLVPGIVVVNGIVAARVCSTGCRAELVSKVGIFGRCFVAQCKAAPPRAAVPRAREHIATAVEIINHAGILILGVSVAKPMRFGWECGFFKRCNA